MKVVCAWCGKDMGEKDGKGVEGTSHSMCEECLAKWKAQKADRMNRKNVGVAGVLEEKT